MRLPSVSERKGSKPRSSRTSVSNLCLSLGNRTPSPRAQVGSHRRVHTLAARTLSRTVITECRRPHPWVLAILHPTVITTEATLSSNSTSSRHCKGRAHRRTITTLNTTRAIRSIRPTRLQATGGPTPNRFSTTKSPNSTQERPTSKVAPLTLEASDRPSNLSSGPRGTQARTTLLQARTTQSRSSKLRGAT